MYRTFFWMASLLIVFSACKRSDTPSSNENYYQDAAGSFITEEAFEVIYSLSLPTDIVGLLEETGTSFNPEFLIPLDRVMFYEEADQMALLMGALGVDLSYCKLYERIIESADTYKQIELLANKLGLPEEIFNKSSTDLELYINKPDSLTKLIDQVYRDVDSYFKENEQSSLASLSLLGGWLEAMYIGVRIYQDKSIIEMGDRILQQKYGLNSLIGLLANHQESLMVRSYVHSLKKLKDAFEKVEIKYSQEGFKMDQEERTFHASVAEMTYEPETLENICKIILQVRAGTIQ